MFLRSRRAVLSTQLLSRLCGQKGNISLVFRDQRQPCQPLDAVLVLASAVRVTGCNDQQKRIAPKQHAFHSESIGAKFVFISLTHGVFMKKILATVAAFFASISIAFAAVNVNNATKEELMTLKGVGEVKAQAIIDFRTKNGPFKTMADVDKVPGIGEGTLKAMGADATLTGKTTAVVEKKADAKPAAATPAAATPAAAPAKAAAAPVAAAAVPVAAAAKDVTPAKKADKAMAADAKKADVKEAAPAKKETAAEKKAAMAEEKKAKAEAAKKEKADKAMKAAEDKKAKAEAAKQAKADKAAKAKGDVKSDKPMKKDDVKADAKSDAPKK